MMIALSDKMMLNGASVCYFAAAHRYCKYEPPMHSGFAEAKLGTYCFYCPGDMMQPRKKNRESFVILEYREGEEHPRIKHISLENQLYKKYTSNLPSTYK